MKIFNFFQFYLLGIFIWIFSFLFLFIANPTDEYIKNIALQITYIGVGISIPSLFYFFKTYKQKLKIKITDYLSFLFFLSFILFVIISPESIFKDIEIKTFYIETTKGPYKYIVSLYLMVFYILGILTLNSRMKKTKDLILKSQFKYFLYSFLSVTNLLILCNWIFPVYLSIPQTTGIGPLFYLIEVGLILNFIKKYRFFDIKRLTQKTLTYLSNLVIYSTLFSLTLKLFLKYTYPIEVLVLINIIIFIIAISFWHKTYFFWCKIWNFIFYKTTDNPINLLKLVSPSFRHSVKDGVDELVNLWNLKSGEFIFSDFAGKYADIEAVVQNYGFIAFIKEELDYLKLDSDDHKNLKQSFKELDISLALPVYFNQKYIGFLKLTKKDRNKLFSIQEVQALKKLMVNASSHLYHEQRALNKKELDVSNPDEFWQDLMHEVQHPLMIAGNAKNFISTDNLNESCKKMLNSSHDNVQDLNNKFNKITEAIKWNQQRVSVDFSPLKFGYLIDLLTKDFPEVSFQITTVSRDCYINSNKNIFLKIFSELIKNSYFFNKENLVSRKKVTIKAKNVKSKLIIDVIDNGKGIKEENFENIFKLLFVEAFSRNEKDSGLGIGLSLVKSMVKLHAGKISVLESNNLGTTMRIIFNIL